MVYYPDSDKVIVAAEVLNERAPIRSRYYADLSDAIHTPGDKDYSRIDELSDLMSKDLSRIRPVNVSLLAQKALALAIDK